MRILTGFMAASRGQVTVAGYDVCSQPLEVRRRVGYLPENVSLYGEMTVRSYLTPSRLTTRPTTTCLQSGRLSREYPRLAFGLRAAPPSK